MFVVLLLLSIVVNTHELHLLAIGDSFDRIFGHEWCSVRAHHYMHHGSLNASKAIIWGSPDLGIKDHQTPMYCADPLSNDSYAQIMICGSSATGPYYHYHDHKYETKYRIELGLKNYFEDFKRLPDRIVLCTIQWDTAYQMYMRAREWSGEVEQLLVTFESNMNARIDDIRAIVNEEIKRRQAAGDRSVDNSKIDVALRTTTWRIERGSLTSRYNEVVRRIAAYRQLSLYDLDYDVWSSVDYHRTNDNCANFGLFRDDIGHPVALYSYFSVEKMMSLAYSPFMHTAAHNESFSVPVLSSLPDSDQTTFRLMRAACPEDRAALNHLPLPISDMSRISEVLPLPGCGPAYFSRVVDGKRGKWFIGEVSHHFHKVIVGVSGKVGESEAHAYERHMKANLEHMLVPSSETRLVTPSLLESIPTKGVMPLFFNSTQIKAFTVDSLSDPTAALEYYIVFTNRAIFRLPSAKVLALYKIPPEFVLHRVDRIWLDLLCFETPTLFQDNALYRFSDEKTVYATVDLTRRMVSATVMSAKGFTQEMVTLLDRDRMERVVLPIPLGEPLI